MVAAVGLDTDSIQQATWEARRNLQYIGVCAIGKLGEISGPSVCTTNALGKVFPSGRLGGSRMCNTYAVRLDTREARRKPSPI
jgi:hypothetical protein